MLDRSVCVCVFVVGVPFSPWFNGKPKGKPPFRGALS